MSEILEPYAVKDVTWGKLAPLFNLWMLLWDPLLGRFVRERDWVPANREPLSRKELVQLLEALGPPEPHYKGQGPAVHAFRTDELPRQGHAPLPKGEVSP